MSAWLSSPVRKYQQSEKGRATRAIREARPEVRARKRAYDSRPERKANVRVHNAMPARREAERVRNANRELEMRVYRQRPERRQRTRELDNASYLARGSRWIKAHVHGSRLRAVKDGVPHESTAVKELLKAAPTHCPVLGVELTVGGRLRDSSTTIDRNTPVKGYVRGNMTVISLLANRIKTNATAAQVLAVGDWMKTLENNNAP